MSNSCIFRKTMLCAILCITCLIYGNSFAANLYVDNGSIESGSQWDGVNGHTYTGSPGSGTGYTTIKAAVDAMAGGDDIYIRQGTYYEHDILVPSSKSGSSSNYSSMQSYPGEWAIIDGQNSCQQNPYAVIRNGAYVHSPPDNLGANYWIFERLEITGGGTRGGTSAAGIWWNGGPFTVRFCYIHNNGNYITNVDNLPAGLTGNSQRFSTIEFNYFYHNSPQGTTNGNAREICLTGSTSYPSGSAPNYYPDYYVRSNEIRYNYVVAWGGEGIATKANQEMDSDRSVHNTTYQSWGDKIHHNIVTGTRAGGIFYQQDYVQIYNNIVVTDPVNLEDMGIQARKYRSSGKDVVSQVIYNNTIINPSDAGIGNPHKDDRGCIPRWYIYNNIVDSNDDTSGMEDISISESGWSKPQISSTEHIDIDANYIYRVSTSSENAILIGSNSYNKTSYQSAFPGKSLYVQPYDSNNRLYLGTSGANQYITVGSHPVESGGSRTIQNSGRGGTHPYLSDIEIPAYIGATNPNDSSWVEGVMSLANQTNLMAYEIGSTPSWVEGNGVVLQKLNLRLFAIDTIGVYNDSESKYFTNTQTFTLSGKYQNYVGFNTIHWRLTPSGAEGDCEDLGNSYKSSSTLTLAEGDNELTLTAVSSGGEQVNMAIIIHYDPNY